MKKCAVMLFALLFAAACSKTEPSESQKAADRAASEAVPSAAESVRPARAEVTFDNEVYVLQNAQSTATEVINEYLRAGETFDDYTRMFALQAFHLQVPVEEYVQTFEQNLNNLQQSVTNVFTFGDEAKGTRGISFFIEGNGALEYNIFNFRKAENGDIEGIHFVARIPAGKYEAGSPAAEQFTAQYGQRSVWQKLMEETPFPRIYAEVPAQEETSVSPNPPAGAGMQADASASVPAPAQPAAADASQVPSPSLRVTRALALLKNISDSQRRYYAQHQAYASDFSQLDVQVGGANGTVTEDADFSYRLFPASMTLSSKDAAVPFTFALFFTKPVPGQADEFVACYDTSFQEAVTQAEAQGLEHCRKK